MKSILNLTLLSAVGSTAFSFASGHDNHEHNNYGKRKLDSRGHRTSDHYGQYAAKLEPEDFVRPDWDEATRKAKEYLEGWSVEELVTLTSGVGWARGPSHETFPLFSSSSSPFSCLNCSREDGY
jgi:hypothetical protein